MANEADAGAGFDFTEEDEAVRALQARGVTGATELIAFASPKAIVAACRQWDGKKNAGIGLLVKMVKDGGVEDVVDRSPGARLRQAFDRFVATHPEGSTAVIHQELQMLRPGSREEPCHGRAVVQTAAYPVVEVECDRCGLVFGLPAKTISRELSHHQASGVKTGAAPQEEPSEQCQPAGNASPGQGERHPNGPQPPTPAGGSDALPGWGAAGGAAVAAADTGGDVDADW